MKTSNNSVGKVLFLIIIILLAGFFSYFDFMMFTKQQSFVKNSQVSQGEVISYKDSRNSDGNILYSPVVRYLGKDGQELTFNSMLSSNRPSQKIGEIVPILIPSDGSRPQINSFMDLWFGVIILSLFALLAVVIAALTIYFTIVNYQRQKMLKARGTTIQAKVTGVNENTYGRRGGLAWTIQAQWQNPNNNQVYTFDSETMSYDPKAFVGETIDVTILPDDPRIYAVDISKLPMAAN